MDAPPFVSYLGIELVERGEDTAELAIDLKPHHLNKRGVAHGGVVTALLDSALGAAVVAAIPPEAWCATTSLTTQFVSGGTTGRLTARGRVVGQGRRVAFAEGEARDASGRLVATAQGTWFVWPHRPGHVRLPVGGRIVLDETGERVRVGKVVAVGRNYSEHAVEMGNPADAAPVLFLKPPTSVVLGDGPLPIPVGSGSVHHEVELVAVVGEGGRHIPRDRALEHVMGFGVGIDLTLRDLQSEAKKRGEPWSIAKGFDGSAPVSTFVARDKVGDGTGLPIRLDVNDETRQSGNTSQMTHSVADIVHHVSRWMTLERGDLLFTGTPAGVGPVSPGDHVVAEIERVGRIEIVIESETRP